MKYKVNNNDDAVDINVSDAGDKKEELINAIRECANGECSCPSQEYDKVESILVDDTGADIQISIKSKDGETIDKKEVEKCLEYTEGRLSND